MENSREQKRESEVSLLEFKVGAIDVSETSLVVPRDSRTQELD